MTVAENDIFEVTARMEFQGSEDVINVFQFRVKDITDSDDLAIIDDLLDIMETTYATLSLYQSTLLSFKDITFTNVTQGIQFGAFGWDSLTTGVSTADALPSGVSALVNFSTFLGKVILKKYFGVFTEAVNDSDATWTQVFLDLLVSVAQYLLNDIAGTAAVYQYGYLSPKALGYVLPVSATVSDVPAYQRRRKPGRGS